jgi:hypothetical protein
MKMIALLKQIEAAQKAMEFKEQMMVTMEMDINSKKSMRCMGR